MTRVSPIVLLLVGTALGAGAPVDSVPDVLSGREIMRRVHANWTRYDTAADVTLEIVARSGRTMRRELEALRMRVDGEARTLIRMTHPPDLRGTTLLVIENERSDDDRFLYLPVSRRVRRIAAGQRADRVLGTDFSYEDLGAGDLEDYVHRRLEDAELDGHPCFVIRTEEESPSPLSVARTSWISRRTFVPLRVDYERHGRPSRRLTTDPSSVEALGPGAWLPRRIEMRDLIRGTRTELAVESLDVTPTLDARHLTLRHLETLSKREIVPEGAEPGASE